MIGPVGSDLARSSTSRVERISPGKLVGPVRLVRSNTSANHSTSRRHLTVTPPRKAHPSESRYSNQSWKERKQEAEVEDISSTTTPVEPFANRTSLVGAIAQSARSSSNRSVLVLAQVASATVAAIANSSPASISENKEDELPSPPSPVTQSQWRQLSPPLPMSWRRALQSLLVAVDVLCIAGASVRLWTRLSAPTTRGFHVVLPSSVFIATSAERVMGAALWEAMFAIFHSASVLRLLVSDSALWRHSNRVAPLHTRTGSSTAIQRIKISSHSSASVGVALHANAVLQDINARRTVKMSLLECLTSMVRLRVPLVVYPNDSSEGLIVKPWTRGSTVLLLTHWILQLCIAADMSAGLPMLPSTPHEFYVTVIVLNMWLLPVLCHVARRFGSRQLRRTISQFFHLVWIAFSLVVTVIGVAVIPLAMFHQQCRRSYSASTHRFDSTKRLDPEWMGRASLVMEWLVTTSAGPAALRVIAGLCVVVTVESIHASIAADVARLQQHSEQPRHQSDPSMQRKTSLTSAIPDITRVKAVASGSRWMVRLATMKRLVASPRLLACVSGLILGVIVMVGHSSRTSALLPDSCALQVRPWFDSQAQCTMLALDCSTDTVTSLNDLLPPELPASSTSQVKFLSIRHCAQLQIGDELAQMSSAMMISLANATVTSWMPPLSYPAHPALRTLTLADATISAPFLSAELPPVLLGEILTCGSNSAFPPVQAAQRMLMPLVEERHLASCG